MRYSGLSFLLAALLCGCSGEARVTLQPSPRPVSVLKLRETDPAQSLLVTGAVGSWKTTDLGFEVSGRVQYVIEPETNVGAVGSSQEQPIARIDPQKYETAVESARAQISSLTRQKAAAQIEREQVLPAQRDAAVAGKELAQTVYNRDEQLSARNAIAREEFERSLADLKAAQARVAQLDATMEAQSAKVTSLEAQIEQARAAAQDAQRDLEDCTIEASFRGQIARVHVIPGGTVQRGEPVVTLQMMDPVKVEFEVSAERVRQMQYRDTLDIILNRADGSVVRQEGVIWNTDSAADPSTRTFTITVLIRNRLVGTQVPDGVDAKSLAKTRDVWKLVRGILDDSDRNFVDQHAIQKDDQGEYLWKIIESDGDVANQSRSSILNVEKVRVTTGDQQLDFLGLWTFQDVTIDKDAVFDQQRDRVLGKLVLPGDAKEVSGDTVLFEREQWLLRPGDLVGVDLTGASMPLGFYVPINAIKERSGKYYVFAVEGTEKAGKVRQVEVAVSDGPNTLKRIEAIGDQPLTPGATIVLGGVHYLIDGEAVNIASEVEAG